MDEGRPLFQQIAEQVEAAILDGSLPPDGQAPSTNELAAFHRINPATAAKGVNQLVQDGILYKKRGIGMFVAPDARERVLTRRREAFGREFVGPLVQEARRLGLTPEDVKKLIETWGDSQ
jgi:DNA-binding transcriptional regulator YhcF (GntR family)